MDHQAERAQHAAQRDPYLRHRPLWKRLAYPLLGLILVAVGVVGVVTPLIAGWPLLLIGLPLIFAIHPPWEASVRRAVQGLWPRRRRSRKGRREKADDEAEDADDQRA